jgi:hypothetical protein
MVICASCRQYTDDGESLCRHCATPLREDTMEEVRAASSLRPEIAQLVEDRERARLVASGVVGNHAPSFLYDDGQRRTVLAALLSKSTDREKVAAAVLFASCAYLVQQDYCALGLPDQDGAMQWDERRPWDGQEQSPEAYLASHAGAGLIVKEAIHRAVERMMDFRFELVQPPLVRTPGLPRQPPVRDLSPRSAVDAVIRAGREVAMPAYDESAACADTYQLVRTFVQSDAERASFLAQAVLDVLDWFHRYEQDPTVALTR